MLGKLDIPPLGSLFLTGETLAPGNFSVWHCAPLLPQEKGDVVSMKLLLLLFSYILSQSLFSRKGFSLTWALQFLKALLSGYCG